MRITVTGVRNSVVLLLLFSLLSFVCLLVVKQMQDKGEFDDFGKIKPEHIAARFFVSPAAQWQELQGRGVEWQGYDYWIRFKSELPVELRDKEKYKPCDPEVAASNVVSTGPEDKESLRDLPNLTCLMADPGSKLPGSSGQYFVVNNKTHVCFFHCWAAR